MNKITFSQLKRDFDGKEITLAAASYFQPFEQPLVMEAIRHGAYRAITVHPINTGKCTVNSTGFKREYVKEGKAHNSHYSHSKGTLYFQDEEYYIAVGRENYCIWKINQ